MEQLSEYEIYIVNRIAIKTRWCNKHISREDLLQGRKVSDLDLYGEAIDSLVRKKILRIYKSQGRDDYCLPKTHLNMVISLLKKNVGKYDFINPFLITRIK